MEAGLKITSWNVNGLTRCKLDDSDFVNKLCENDIIILYETWTNENSDIEIDGYKSYNMSGNFKIDVLDVVAAALPYILKTNYSRG